MPPVDQNCAGLGNSKVMKVCPHVSLRAGRQGGKQAAMSVMSSGIKAHAGPVAARGRGTHSDVTGWFEGLALVKRGLGNWTSLGFRSQPTTCRVIVGKFFSPSEPLASAY